MAGGRDAGMLEAAKGARHGGATSRLNWGRHPRTPERPRGALLRGRATRASRHSSWSCAA